MFSRAKLLWQGWDKKTHCKWTVHASMWMGSEGEGGPFKNYHFLSSSYPPSIGLVLAFKGSKDLMVGKNEFHASWARGQRVLHAESTVDWFLKEYHNMAAPGTGANLWIILIHLSKVNFLLQNIHFFIIIIEHLLYAVLHSNLGQSKSSMLYVWQYLTSPWETAGGVAWNVCEESRL